MGYIQFQSVNAIEPRPPATASNVNYFAYKYTFGMGMGMCGVFVPLHTQHIIICSIPNGTHTRTHTSMLAGARNPQPITID